MPLVTVKEIHLHALDPVPAPVEAGDGTVKTYIDVLRVREVAEILHHIGHGAFQLQDPVAVKNIDTAIIAPLYIRNLQV